MEPESLDRESVESLTQALLSDFRRRGVDGHTAEDMIQEAWLRTLRNRRHPVRLEAWLRVVGARLLVEFTRKNRSRLDHELEAGRRERWSAPPASLDSKILRLVDELPAPYGEVVRLRYVEDEEVAAIARRLRRSEPTVRSQLKRGLQRLRTRIEERSGPESWSLLPLAFLRRAGSLFDAHPRRVVGLGLASLTVIAWLGFLTWPGRAGQRVDAASASYARAPAAIPSPLVAAPGARSPLETLGRTAPAQEESDALARAAAGIVRAPDRTPLPGARIFRGPADASRSELVATADELGRFSVARVDVSEFLWATHPDFLSSRRVHVLMGREEQPIDLRLETPAGRLTLRLRDSRGVPLANLPVELDWDRAVTPAVLMDESGAVQMPMTSIASVTDFAGCVVLPSPPRGQARLRVFRSGQARLSRALELAPGEQTLELTLNELPTLTGRAVDSRGRPAGRARVAALQDGPRPCAEAQTDELGRFGLAGFEPGACELLVFEDPACGTDSAVMELHLGADGAAELLVELSPRFTVRGRATHSGAPLAGARVARLGALQEGAITTTDAQGAFAFPCSMREEYRLALYVEGSPWPVHCLEGVRPGGEPVELSCGAAPALATLVLEFVNEDPTLIPAMVEVGLRQLGFWKSILRPVDRESRRCELRVPVGEDVVLIVWIPGLGSLNLGRSRIEHDEIRRITIPDPALVRFLVERPDDEPTVPVRARIDRTGFGNPIFDLPYGTFPQYELTPGPDGCTFTARVLPGTLSCSFVAEGLAHAPALIEARAGVAQSASIRLVRGVPVEVSVPVTVGENTPSLSLVRADGQIFLYSPPEKRREDGRAWFLVDLPPDTVGIVATTRTRVGRAPLVLERLKSETPARIEIELLEPLPPASAAGSNPR